MNHPTTPPNLLDEEALRTVLKSLDGPYDDELELDMSTGFVALLAKLCKKHGRFDVLEEFILKTLDQPEEKYRELGMFLTMMFASVPEIKESVLTEVRAQVPDVLPHIEM